MLQRSRLFPPGISNRTLFLILTLALAASLFFIFFFSPPSNFPRGIMVTVPEGLSVAEISSLFAEKHLVRSATGLEYFIRYKSGIAMAGDYVFREPEAMPAIARRLVDGDYGIAPIKVTIPEGATADDIGNLIARQIPDFDAETFIAQAQPQEGYLFPDTYYFQPTWSIDRIIETLTKQFRTATKPLTPLLDHSGRTLEQVVIMASLVEREARTTESRRLIAGILWKRLDAGMPLQVDAVFPYIVGRNTFELSRKDLATSSPYNTYRYRGLPIGPIANPGLASLTAALTPIESDYWFYLSDRFGTFHYAVDFAEHKRNKAKYLP
ncbi:MAG: endolytic transglycosylase MltG [Candidatus Vogelbacteria bacterium]